MTTTATGRPPLGRYRADLVLTVELGAADEADAERRLEELVEELYPRLVKAVRNASGRRGAPTLAVYPTVLEPSAV